LFLVFLKEIEFLNKTTYLKLLISFQFLSYIIDKVADEIAALSLGHLRVIPQRDVSQSRMLKMYNILPKINRLTFN
jgi:hypothetical protein